MRGGDPSAWMRPSRTSSVSKTPCAGSGRSAWAGPARVGGGGGAGRRGTRVVPTAAAIGRALTAPPRARAWGSESATIPPPAPSQSRPSRSSNVRMATLSSSPAERAGVADRAGVDLAAGALQLGDDLQRLDLGRAGDRAGRERRAQQLGVADPGAQRARGRGDQMPEPGVRLGASGARRATEPYSQTRPRSLRIRSTIITCSARVLGERAAPASAAASAVARGGALDRPRSTISRPRRRRNSSGDRVAMPPSRRGEHGARSAGRARIARPRTARRRRPSSSAVEPQAELAWKISPGGDPLAARRATAARWPARRRPASSAQAAPGGAAATGRRCARRAGERARAGRAAGALGQRGAARRRSASASNHHRPSGVLAQDVVVEGEVEVGKRRPVAVGARGRRSIRAAEPVAEPPEPAAADGAVGVAVAPSTGTGARRAARTGPRCRRPRAAGRSRRSRRRGAAAQRVRDVRKRERERLALASAPEHLGGGPRALERHAGERRRGRRRRRR